MTIAVVDSNVDEIIGQPDCFEGDNRISEKSGKENTSSELNFSGFEQHALQSSSVVSCVL